MQISHDKEEQDVGLYKFVLKEEEVFLMPRYAPYQKKTQLLTMEENVSILACVYKLFLSNTCLVCSL